MPVCVVGACLLMCVCVHACVCVCACVFVFVCVFSALYELHMEIAVRQMKVARLL